MAKKLKWKKIGSHKGIVVSIKNYANCTYAYRLVHPSGNTFLIENFDSDIVAVPAKYVKEIIEAYNAALCMEIPK